MKRRLMLRRLMLRRLIMRRLIIIRNMNRSVFRSLALLTGLMLMMTSCGSQAGINLMADVKPIKQDISENTETKALTDSLNGFSWQLLQKTSEEKQTGNVLLSPLSAYFALAMALNGADGNTAVEMKAALDMGEMSMPSLNDGILGWMKALSESDDKAKWSIANSIWYNTGFVVDKGFLQTNADYYLADARMLDFTDASAPGTINGWVKEKTGGKIEEIVSSIKPDVVMYLINAVWFKADWETPFKPSGTQPGTFHAPAADMETEFLSRTGTITSINGALAEGILLPYTDERFAFVALLPAENKSPRDLIKEMNPADFSEMLSGRTESQVSLRIPKFETRFEADLVGILQQMGMKEAFMSDVADFSLMNADRSKNLYISGVKQKTYCRIDEKGTEASAATSVEMSTTSMPMIDKEIVFDRPFLYGIIDVETGIPMFLGLMEDPGE